MINIYFKNGKEKSIKKLEEIKNDSWIHIESPSDEELIYITEKLALDESLLKDATDRHEIPRFEIESESFYFFTRFAYTDDEIEKTSPLLIIISKTNLVTMCIEPFPKISQLLMQNPQTTQKVKLFIKILAQVQETYNHSLNMTSKNIRIYTNDLEKINNKDIVQFVLFENFLHDFNLALVKTNKDLNTLLSGKILNLTNGEHDRLEDVFLNNSQLIDICNESIRTIINLREANSTIITNNLNRVIKLFTSLTVILTIPTIISSFFGMNVLLPDFSFNVILISTIILCVFALFLFIYKDWL